MIQNLARELFSACRSRRLTLVPIIQSLARLEKSYSKEGNEILCDNFQDTFFGGFTPNSQTAPTLSGNLGSRTVLPDTVTNGKNDDSQSLQMMERPLMSPDELKSIVLCNLIPGVFYSDPTAARKTDFLFTKSRLNILVLRLKVRFLCSLQ